MLNNHPINKGILAVSIMCFQKDRYSENLQERTFSRVFFVANISKSFFSTCLPYVNIDDIRITNIIEYLEAF